MTELLTLAAQFGFPALVCVIVLLAYQKLVERMGVLIETNTSVMQSLRDLVNRSCEQMLVHEQHTAIIEASSGRAEGALGRIEARLERMTVKGQDANIGRGSGT